MRAFGRQSTKVAIFFRLECSSMRRPFGWVAACVLVSAFAHSRTEQSRPAQAPSPEATRLADSERELKRAIDQSGNDRAALVRNLEDYLLRFPDTRRKPQVYRALVESSMQLRDSSKALDYAERLIALNPDDSAMMLFAIDLLERAGQDSGLARAVGYANRVLDRLERPGPEGKRVASSGKEWEAEQKRLRTSVYLLRGRIEIKQRNYDAAVKDFETSYRLSPNVSAAFHLGEIAELRKNLSEAIDHYLTAFVLPDPSEVRIDRMEIRRRLGNLWRVTHRGEETGLGERMLAAYDRMMQDPAQLESGKNQGVTEPLAFVLRRPDGTAPLKLAEMKGKVVVLNFWATWCLPCRELEPLLEVVERRFESKSAVAFLAVNYDEDESRVMPYMRQQNMHVPVVFADGLDRLLDIRIIPTVIVLDRMGKIVYRAQGFSPEGFVETLSGVIDRALAGVS